MSMWVGDEDEDEEDWGQEPDFADPAIRIEFEASLGAFILAFNEVDFYIGKILQAEATKVGKQHLLQSTNYFAERLAALDFLAPPGHVLADLPFARMREIAAIRNHLAHGHFDQDPYSGTYEIVLRKQRKNYPAATIAKLQTELTQFAMQLHAILAFKYLYPQPF